MDIIEEANAEIKRILDEYLERFELTSTLGTDFAYYPKVNEVQYAMIVVDEGERIFQEFIHELQPQINCDPFLTALFHEIGHHETWEDLDDDIIKSCYFKKAVLNKMVYFDSKRAHYKYFRLPDERAATEWGLNYIVNHIEEVKELWSKLQPAIMRFYELNNVELN